MDWVSRALDPAAGGDTTPVRRVARTSALGSGEQDEGIGGGLGMGEGKWGDGRG